jgi:hypothetical protein
LCFAAPESSRYCYGLFDLVYGAFITREVEVDRSQALSVFLRKTLFGRSPLAAKSLLLDLPLEVFRGYLCRIKYSCVGELVPLVAAAERATDWIRRNTASPEVTPASPMRAGPGTSRAVGGKRY